MNFCKNCGQKINSDEQFCGNCGTTVTENHKSNSSSNEAQSTKNSNFSIYINDIEKVFNGMLTKPVSTIENCNKVLKTESCSILILFLTILFGLFNIWAFSNTTGVIDRLFTASKSNPVGFESLFGQLSQYITGNVYKDKIFFVSGFLFIIAIIVLLASNYLIGKYIFKSSVKLVTILKVIACSAIPFIVAFLLNIVLSYVDLTLGLMVLFIGMLISLISLFRGITKALNISQEITIFIIPISCLVMFSVEYIILSKIITNIFASVY